MFHLIFVAITSFVSFCRHTWGTIFRPYASFREIVSSRPRFEVIFIIILAITYFLFAALLRGGMRNPYLLSRNLNKLIVAALISFFWSSGWLYLLGRLFGGKGNYAGIYSGWAYSLLPTIIWFTTTSIFYLLLPPPRTVSLEGQIFSLFFITFSLALFFWKAILYYLTLRFALKLDLAGVAKVTSIFLPLELIYAVMLYRLNIFRIPFL